MKVVLAVVASIWLQAGAVSAATIDGAFNETGPLSAGQIFNLTVVGRGGVPASGVGSVALNVTVVNPGATGYLTVWPAGQEQPTASNLNFVAGQTVPNMVIVPVGAGGQISLSSANALTGVIVDVLGWFPAAAFVGLTPQRFMDTRLPVAPPPPQILTFSAGTHLVNSAIPAGRYVAANAMSGCYWERLSGLGGSFSEILSNDFQGFAGRAIVDIRATDVAFKFDADCGQFKTYSAPTAPSPTIAPGAHAVGAQISSGTYFANASSGCYWEHVSSFDGGGSSVIANDFVGSAGPQYVTISPTDVGFIADSDCGTWVRVS